MSPASRRLKDPILERYLADALDPAGRADLERVLGESEPDRARVAELRADSAAFLALHPPGQMVARFEKEQARRRWWRWPVLFAPIAAAATAVLLFVAAPPAQEDPLTIKGTLGLAVHRKTGQTSVKVEAGQPVAPGDALRFELSAPGPGFAAVVSRDASGQVTVYHPFAGTAAAAFDAREPLLPTAIELDEVLGAEELFALYAKSAFELGPAISALEAGQDPAAALPGVEVTRRTLTKVRPR